MPKPFKKTKNGKPALSGGNTIKQAEKPSQATITLPASLRDGPSWQAFIDMKDELRQKQKDLFRMEQALQRALNEKEKLREVIAKLKNK